MDALREPEDNSGLQGVATGMNIESSQCSDFLGPSFHSPWHGSGELLLA